MKHLIIVESPTKAKTITQFVGKEYVVTSSYGHIRDLPKSTMGIDVEHNFTPRYIVPKEKKKIVDELKKQAKGVKSIYFATDEDREGEAISWHLASLLGVAPEEAQRITFHEITKTAILNALKNPKIINLNLVDAQQARRVLDRLVGYELSPFLWKKVVKGLSAGRVQSVAVRLIVEREREIQTFKQEEYWTIPALFLKKEQASSNTHQNSIPTTLYKIGVTILEKFTFQAKAKVEETIKAIREKSVFTIKAVTKKEMKKNPPPPLTTSTLQQQAYNHFGFSASRTMSLAQQLYEGVKIDTEGSVGLITYMRTDSVHLGSEFLDSAQAFIKKQFGDSYALKSPRRFKTKSKLAQEAHEAIRPTDINRTPELLKSLLDDHQFKLYSLIWKRACASQMTEAVLNQTNIVIATEQDSYTFKATGSILVFDGFLTVIGVELKETILPVSEQGETVLLSDIHGEQHFTQPPPRYTEATLVKTLEEKGIGRPSTYAPTIATIQKRNYIIKEEKKLKPTEIAFLVNDLLVKHFPNIVDVDFTAQMEDKLDAIAQGELSWQPMIEQFYGPFKTVLTAKYEEISKKELVEEKTDEVCEKCQSPMIIKLGRYGKFLACSAFPSCKNTKDLNRDGKEENTAEGTTTDAMCPKCDHPLKKRQSRYGSFIGCSNYPTCTYINKTGSSLGITCPQCATGEISARRTKRGRLFYSCNQYPECKFALWDKPTGEHCSLCHALLVEQKDKIKCSNKECASCKQEETSASEKG